MQITVDKGKILIECNPVELTVLEFVFRKYDYTPCGRAECRTCPVAAHVMETITQANNYSVEKVNRDEVSNFYNNE